MRIAGTRILLLLILLASFPVRAEVSGARNCSAGSCTLMIEGRIAANDVALVKQALEQTQGAGRLLLMLDSEGGDIAAAIEIGRLIRRWADSVALISLNSKCFSACVFVLAGGLHRTVHGKVGIHRPFGAAPKTATYESTQKEFRALEQSARKFLQEVNIPVALFDEMMSVPPQKLRILSEEELARYGVSQNDPIYEEVQDGKAAQALGVSKEEYLRRKYRSERICNAISVNERKAGLSVSISESAHIVAACKTAVLRAESDSASNQPAPATSKRKQ